MVNLWFILVNTEPGGVREQSGVEQRGWREYI